MERRWDRGCGDHEDAARSRRPLRSPDPPLGPARCARSSSPSATASTSSTCSRRSDARRGHEFVRSMPPGGKVLFVGTKKQAQETIAEEAARCGMPYVNQRWLGGTLTNFITILTRMRPPGRAEQRRRTATSSACPRRKQPAQQGAARSCRSTLGGVQGHEQLPGRGLHRRPAARNTSPSPRPAAGASRSSPWSTPTAIRR